MARQRDSSNGHLEDALAQLIQAQATLTVAQATLARDMADMKRESEAVKQQTDARFAQIMRLLEGLPEAVRKEFGFNRP